MDPLDVRLLRAMGDTPFAHGARAPSSLRAGALARRVGSTRQTVSERLHRLERAGVLRGFEAFPNLRLLNLTWSIYHWRDVDPDRRQRAFETLDLVDGVAGVINFVGPNLCVDLYWERDEERDRRLRLLRTLMGGGEPAEFFGRAMPAVRGALSRLDWRIVRALRGRALRPLEEVAAEVGASGRTVRRRVAAMVEGGALDVVPMLALERVAGLPLAFLVHLAPDAGRRTTDALLRAFDAWTIGAWVPRSPVFGHFDMVLVAGSVAEAERLREQAATTPGVASVETLVFNGLRGTNQWLDDAIARRADGEPSAADADGA